jgi:hypothetical protein
MGIVKSHRFFVFASSLVAAFVACAAPTPEDESSIDARRRAFGESEDDSTSAASGTTTAKDGAAPKPSSDASIEAGMPPTAASSGCADGTREGLLDIAAFPNVAACGGSWSGNVANARPLCAAGWAPCLGPHPAVKTITFEAATAFAGCFAIDTAHDNSSCQPSCSRAIQLGIDSASDIDMGAIGRDCRNKDARASSCLGSGRIDFSRNSGTGCNFAPGLSGVVCCKE